MEGYGEGIWKASPSANLLRYLLQERILKHKYRSLADLEDDIVLLCANARKFNQESSQIYQDSLELEKGFVAARAVLDDTEEGGGGADSEGEEPGGSSQQTQQSTSSSVHVVEIDTGSYASDNSDGEWYTDLQVSCHKKGR
jgi:SWI/SNF-related matrix-associated actin-dependent regulator of chromatin subfamily A protein 2/4